MKASRFDPSFYEWLTKQLDRLDQVGQLGKISQQDKHWPKKAWRLNVILAYAARSHVKPELVKLAHAEWREVRQRAAR